MVHLAGDVYDVLGMNSAYACMSMDISELKGIRLNRSVDPRMRFS
jgi:hypothetical protein